MRHICLRVSFYFKCVCVHIYIYIYIYIYTHSYIHTILLLLHRSAIFAVKNTELRTEKEI